MYINLGKSNEPDLFVPSAHCGQLVTGKFLNL